ncbi:hypothetical protein QE449_002511 [Rhodococcus sp. SORGH_AS303]|nr:hypothetical protein [Rhodococcus sp. SORGH_AS_0303]
MPPSRSAVAGNRHRVGRDVVAACGRHGAERARGHPSRGTRDGCRSVSLLGGRARPYVPAASVLPGVRADGSARRARTADDDVGRRLRRHPRPGRRRHPARGGDGPLGGRLRFAGHRGGRVEPDAGGPHRRDQRDHRHRRRADGSRGPPRWVLAGRHVLLPGRRVPLESRHRQHHHVRQSGGHPRGAPSRDPGERGHQGCRVPRRARVHASRGDRLDGPHRVPVARPGQDRQVAASTSCSSSTTGTRSCPASPSAGSSRWTGGSPGRARRSRNC